MQLGRRSACEIDRGEVLVAYDRDAERKAHLRGAIIGHLRRYPLAGDTPEGIVSCWLPARGCEDARQFITEVVEAMVLACELASRPLPDGQTLYTRGPALAPRP
jgi:hypothetical protein